MTRVGKIYQLADNEQVAKLIEAQRHMDKAAALFTEVFSKDGAPNDEEPVLEKFHSSMGDCCKCVERLAGAVVYNAIF